MVSAPNIRPLQPRIAVIGVGELGNVPGEEDRHEGGRVLLKGMLLADC